MVDWKDGVFSKLFGDRGNVLRLCMTLNPEDLGATEDDVEAITLENVLTTALYNDLGFMVGGRLVILVEAQSTWTPNIISRAFFYLAHTCQRLIAKKEWSVYARKKIPLPKPEIYVVYTGSEDVEEGMHSFAEETARRMIEDSYPVDAIARISGLSAERVNALMCRGKSSYPFRDNQNYPAMPWLEIKA